MTFLVLIPATLWCYTKVLPSYQATVAAGANGVLALVGSARTISPHEEGGWTSEAATRRRFVTGPPDYGSQQLESLFLSLAILPALILATPLPWRRRLALLSTKLKRRRKHLLRSKGGFDSSAPFSQSNRY